MAIPQREDIWNAPSAWKLIALEFADARHQVGVGPVAEQVAVHLPSRSD